MEDSPLMQSSIFQIYSVGFMEINQEAERSESVRLILTKVGIYHSDCPVVLSSQYAHGLKSNMHLIISLFYLSLFSDSLSQTLH